MESLAFANCGIQTITLSLCSIIASRAFGDCIKLTTASFPNCSRIYSAAFRDCENLVSLYLMNTARVVVLASTNVFDGTPIDNYSDVAGRYGSVFVPSALYSSYIKAKNWSTISDRIVGI